MDVNNSIILEKLIKYGSVLNKELDIDKLEKDATRISGAFLSTNKLSIALRKFKKIEKLPILDNFHKLIDILPEEYLLRHDMFYSYEEYERYIYSYYYFHNEESKLSLPTIDKILFILMQYFSDFDSFDSKIKSDTSLIFNTIPSSHKMVMNYIKKVFDSSFKKFIMLLDYDTLNINTLKSFVNVKHSLSNDFYSIRYLHWEYINLFDINNNVKINENLIRRNKEKFINYLW
ncbi:MAG: hypothetical protein ACRCX2_01150 [Paraclostridium sp.]